MTQLRNKLTAALTKIHNQEEGMEALQTVLIMALATVVLAFAYKMMAGDGTTANGETGGIVGKIGGLVGEAVAKYAVKAVGF